MCLAVIKKRLLSVITHTNVFNSNLKIQFLYIIFSLLYENFAQLVERMHKFRLVGQRQLKQKLICLVPKLAFSLKIYQLNIENYKSLNILSICHIYFFK